MFDTSAPTPLVPSRRRIRNNSLSMVKLFDLNIKKGSQEGAEKKAAKKAPKKKGSQEGAEKQAAQKAPP